MKKNTITIVLFVLLLPLFATAQQDYDDFDGDKVYFYSRIDRSFGEWNEKGEFEKTADYEQRLRTRSKKAFDSICFANIPHKYSNSDYLYVEKEECTYDADREQFRIRAKYYEYGYTYSANYFHFYVNIPMSVAERFKKDFYGYGNDVRICVLEGQWCFAGDEFYPKVVNLIWKNQTYTGLKVYPDEGQPEEVVVKFDCLDTNNPYLKGYVWKLSDMFPDADTEEDNNETENENDIEQQKQNASQNKKEKVSEPQKPKQPNYDDLLNILRK